MAGLKGHFLFFLVWQYFIVLKLYFIYLIISHLGGYTSDRNVGYKCVAGLSVGEPRSKGNPGRGGCPSGALGVSAVWGPQEMPQTRWQSFHRPTAGPGPRMEPLLPGDLLGLFFPRVKQPLTAAADVGVRGPTLFDLARYSWVPGQGRGQGRCHTGVAQANS